MEKPKTVKEVMITNVLVVSPDESVPQAVHLLTNNKISCVVVQNEIEPVGILTERDIVQKVVGPGKNIKKLKVQEIMNTPLISVSSETTLEEASTIMQSANIRRVAVIDNNELVGLVTETDIVKEIAKLAKANKKLLFYQNLQSWIVIAFFIAVIVFMIKQFF